MNYHDLLKKSDAFVRTTLNHDLLRKSANQTAQVESDLMAFQVGILAAKIAYHNFEWRFPTLIMFNTIQAVFFNTFLKYYGQTVFIKLGRFIPKHRVRVPQKVIFGESASEITSTVQWLISSKYDNTASYILVCTSKDQECDELKIFETCQKLKMLNVVFIKASHETKKPVAYKYQIISHGNCFNNIPYKLDFISNCSEETCFKGLFKEQLSNLHECRLVMSTVEQPPFMYLHGGTKSPSGIDGELMRIAADMLNATLVLKTPTDGFGVGYYTDKNWTGSLGDIFNNRCHASVCAAPLTSNKHGNFQISFTYYSMDIVWVTRVPTQTDSWEKLIKPFNFYLRIMLFIAFVIIILMNIFCKTNIHLSRELRRVFRIEIPKYSLLFYSWTLFLGLPILKMPSKRSFLITVFTWIWFCFLMRCVYQAALIDSLKHPSYASTINTFADALKDGYPYGGQASLKEFYFDDRHIYDNWKVVELDNFYKTLDDILDGKTNLALAANKEIIKHYLMKYNGTKQLHIIPEKIVNSPMVIYFKKYSALTAPMSHVLSVAFEAGLVQKVFEKYLINDKDLKKLYRKQESGPLNMKHFTGTFVLLIVGWFVSATYFVVEYICGNLEDE